MGKVIIKLRDNGSAIDTEGIKLTGSETMVVEETDVVKKLRKKRIITTEPFVESEPEKTEEKKTEDVGSQDPKNTSKVR